jgi:hypothetical protein
MQSGPLGISNVGIPPMCSKNPKCAAHCRWQPRLQESDAHHDFAHLVTINILSSFQTPQVAGFNPLLNEADIRREWRETKISIQQAIEQVRSTMFFFSTPACPKTMHACTFSPHLAPNQSTKICHHFLIFCMAVQQIDEAIVDAKRREDFDNIRANFKKKKDAVLDQVDSLQKKKTCISKPAMGYMEHISCL